MNLVIQRSLFLCKQIRELHKTSSPWTDCRGSDGRGRRMIRGSDSSRRAPWWSWMSVGAMPSCGCAVVPPRRGVWPAGPRCCRAGVASCSFDDEDFTDLLSASVGEYKVRISAKNRRLTYEIWKTTVFSVNVINRQRLLWGKLIGDAN